MISLHVADNWKDYELIDSGNGQKLERWGQYLVIRPDPRAVWSPSKPSLWSKIDARFQNDSWEFLHELPPQWQVSYQKLHFNLRPASFKHVGVFPEQAVNWDWISHSISNIQYPVSNLKVLNLFAYTGGATLAAAVAGAHVTHVDASRPAMMWASDNAKTTGIPADRIRWIQDDVIKFLKREINRKVKYDAIILDPPKFGRGMKGEVWKILDDLPQALDMCRQLLSDQPVFWLVNAYAADMSSLVLNNLLSSQTRSFGGHIEFGELALKESSSARLLPTSIFARWSK